MPVRPAPASGRKHLMLRPVCAGQNGMSGLIDVGIKCLQIVKRAKSLMKKAMQKFPSLKHKKYVNWRPTAQGTSHTETPMGLIMERFDL